MDFIQAIGKQEYRFNIILNFNKVFSTDEVHMLGSTGEGTGIEDGQPSDKNIQVDGGASSHSLPSPSKQP